MPSTKIVKIDPINPNSDFIKEAAVIIRDGGLVIMPTETVYGIAANALNKQALARLYAIKQRPKEKAFSLLINDKRKIEDFCPEIPASAYKLIEKYWPGALTIILKSKEGGTIAFRMPDNEISLRMIALSGVPIACPSANISGKPAPKNFEEAIQDLFGAVDFAIDAGPTKLGQESSVIDLTVPLPQVLREGAIKKQDLLDTVQKKIVLFVCTGNSCRSVMAKALLEKKLKEIGRRDVEVLSAGVMLLGGFGASALTKQVLLKEGMDVSGHRSQMVTRDMITKSDIILVMEKIHEERILSICPQAKRKLFLLKEFAKIDINSLDIQDPIGNTAEFYERTFDLIREAVERIAGII